MNQEKKGKTRLTLEPLRTHGQEALDTHDTPRLAKATLTGIEIHWRNKARGISIHKAEDLFAEPADPNISAIPESATIAMATFELQPSGAGRPHRVSIRPPDTLLLESQTDAPIVFDWLDRRCLRVAASVLLALATALSAGPGDGDNDDDDPDTDRICLST